VVALTAALLPGLGSPAVPVPPAGVAITEPAARPSKVLPFATAAPRLELLEDGTPFPVPIAVRYSTGARKAVTSGAMLELLTQLLPPGKTGNYAVAAGQDTHVQLYLTTGRGTGMIRASLAKDLTGRPAGAGLATVTVDHLPDNCVQSIVVDASLPDGANVTLNIASCLDGRPGRPAPQIITVEQAVGIATDPRWGLTMDAKLVDAGGKRFANLPKMR
jgi:hypothetical protein